MAPGEIPTTSIPTTTTTSTTTPVAFALALPHTVGYVVQPMAALATYAIDSTGPGTIHIQNESSAPLVITIDRSTPCTIAGADGSTFSLDLGLHEFTIAATTFTAQAYVLDGKAVTW